MEDVLNQLLEKLTKALGDRLVSVVLYGSAVTGDHHEKFSDLNILCVLQQVTSRELADAEPIFRWWREKENPAPLLRHRIPRHQEPAPNPSGQGRHL